MIGKKLVKFVVQNAEGFVGPIAFEHLIYSHKKRKLYEHKKARRHEILYFIHALLYLVSLQFLLRIMSTGRNRLAASPPGHNLIEFASFLFSKRANQMIYLPLISDMREEYNEALFQNRTWKARWIHIRGIYSFFAAIGLDRAFAFVSFFIKAWKSVN
jgi:hypothetical protein